MVKNSEEIQEKGKSCEWPDFDRLDASKPYNYLEDIVNCAKVGAKLSLHGAYALSIALNVKMHLLHPKVHGDKDINNDYLNVSLTKDKWIDRNMKEIYLIWTDEKERKIQDATFWKANHCSFLVKDEFLEDDSKVPVKEVLPRFKNYNVSSEDMDGIYKVMMDKDTKIWKDIPRGKKSNVQFKVENPNEGKWEKKVKSVQSGAKKRVTFRNPTCELF